MIICSETDFTQEKSHFHPTTSIPNSSLLCSGIVIYGRPLKVGFERFPNGPPNPRLQWVEMECSIDTKEDKPFIHIPKEFLGF